jgi:hypothetical protein
VTGLRSITLDGQAPNKCDCTRIGLLLAGRDAPSAGTAWLRVRRLDFTTRSKPTPAAAAVFRWGPHRANGCGDDVRSSSFERPPAGVCDLDADALDRLGASVHALALYFYKPAPDEADEHSE